MKQLFHNLGADEKEMDIFLKLLELGAQPVSVIARHMNTPRSSMYAMLGRLRGLGLIEEFERSGMKYVKCIPVKNLQSLLKDRQGQIVKTVSLLEEELPELSRIENTMSITPKVSFFEGKDAVIRMYRKILEEKEFCSFFHPQSVKRVMPEYFYLIPEELRRNKGKARELLVRCDEAFEYQKKYRSSHHQIKFFQEGMVFCSDTILTKEKIYMVSYGENDVSAVEIFNTSLAETQRIFFEEIWGRI